MARRYALEQFLAERPNRKWKGHFTDTRDFVRTYYAIVVHMLRAGQDSGRLSTYYLEAYLRRVDMRHHRLAGAKDGSLRACMARVERDWRGWPDVEGQTLWARLRAMAAAYVEAFPEAEVPHVPGGELS